MTITVETISELDDDIFNSLYADSVDDLGAGSMWFPDDYNADEKKAYTKTKLNEDIKVLFKDDTTPIIYANGHIVSEYAYYLDGDYTKEKTTYTNLFYWTTAIMGNVDGNKNWVRTAEFFTAMKNYLVSQHSVDGMLIEANKGKSLTVSFKQSQANGVCQGTYSINSDGETDSLIWVY
tara:strand:+ start:1079 stop:1612 length:534 start_codon:yes stop_codon:yes gene_type:complete